MVLGIKLKPLVVVSAVIVFSNVLFIVFNYYASLNAIHEDTKRWVAEVEHAFSLSIDNKATSMQQLASFVANMPRVRYLFNKAQIAYRYNLNNTNDHELSAIRSKLFDYVKPSWIEMTSEYDVRQLHFHFGPGSTSFLRVHRPEKYGDNMDEVRFTVVDVNKHHRPVKGFETGRVYSGIRGVVPVFAKTPSGQDAYVGALEAGTSFTGLLYSLHNEQDCEIAVFLTADHVQRNMWPDFIRQHFGDSGKIGSYFIESATSPDTLQFLAQDQVESLLKAGAGSDFIAGDHIWQVGAFPLRDYRGTTNSTLAHSGIIVCWRDATELWELLRMGLWNNIVYSLIALAIVELVLIIGWRLSQRHLNAIIQDQTRKLQEMATHDGMTGLLNRGAIEQKLAEEVSRALRHGSKFSIIMFDIDHFKKVNDTYGHNAGDEVLKKISARVADLIRTTDQVGRWGGEEFLVLVLETSLKDSMILAERIRVAVAELDYSTADPVTVSLGIAQYEPNENVEEVVKRADTALYHAKEGGRNKACFVG